MALLGVHQRFVEPMHAIPLEASFIGANSYQTFIRNNRGMKRREITDTEITSYNQVLLSDLSMHYVVHASYAMNPCRIDENYSETAERVIRDDLSLIGHLVGTNSYVLHPGSSLDMPWEQAIDNLSDLLHRVSNVMYNTSIGVEIMAGAGTQLLSTTDQINYFLYRNHDLPNVGLCLDTCHVFAAGMDMFQVMDRYLKYIKVIHLNGSKAGFGSKVDRHASVQGSEIPSVSIVKIAQKAAEQLPDVPMILETPSSSLLQDFEYIKMKL